MDVAYKYVVDIPMKLVPNDRGDTFQNDLVIITFYTKAMKFHQNGYDVNKVFIFLE